MAGEAVFVTGASGFLGRAVAERLLVDGREVRALARSDEAAAHLETLGARPVRGDVLDPAPLTDAMRGCSVVYHLAGVNALCLRDPLPMYRANVLGSDHVVRAAAAAGAGRVVYTSSAATIGEPAGVVGREDTPHRGSFLSHYERSKQIAESRVLEVARRVGIDVVCVNPSSVQGPGRTGGTARLLVDVLNGRLPAAVETALSLVDIDDCAAGHLRAEVAGVPGERYLLCAGTMTTTEALDLLEEITGVRPRVRLLPRWAVVAAGSMIGAMARAAGRHPPICGEAVRVLVHGHRYDGSRAERELGVRYTSVRATLRRTLRWYVDRGLVRPLPGLTSESPEVPTGPPSPSPNDET